MQYIVVFSGLVTIIVGLIAAYQFIKSIQHPITRRPGAILGVITVILIVFTVVLANSPLSRGGDALNSTPNTDQLSVTTTVTQQIPSSTSTPTPVPPTPKPTSVASGAVLYQENGSNNWQGWALTSGWKIVENNKLLVNDGSAASNQAGPSAIPPFSLPQGVQNFAVETTITVPQTQGDTHFSITACGSTTGSGWQGYEGLIAYGGPAQAQIFASHDELAQVNFDPGTVSHTYQLEVRGNVITMLVDQAPVAQATDNKFLTCGNQVGLGIVIE